MHSLYDLKSYVQMKSSQRIIGSIAVMLSASLFIFYLGRPTSHTRAATISGPLHLASIPYYSIKGDWDVYLDFE